MNTSAIRRFTRKFLAITAPSVIIILFLLEFVVFRWILPASDWPYRYVIQGPEDVVRYAYRESGMYREGTFRQGFPNEITAKYRINRDGWNSDREYQAQKSRKTRIAIIGDSFVDALQVNVDECFPVILEKHLLQKDYDVEVYRFGFGASPLSQYLHMMRYIKKKFDADIYVVSIQANDFLASVYPVGNWDGDFMQLQYDGSQWKEVKPKPYRPSRSRMLLKKSATFRYLYQNLFLRSGIPSLFDWFKNPVEDEYQMNVKIEDLKKNQDMIWNLSRYVFSQFKAELNTNQKLLLVFDGNRRAIYKGENSSTKRTSLWLSGVAAQARALDIPVLDLHPIFSEDFQLHGQHFEFQHDNHWNVRGHSIVGKSIAEFIDQNGWCER